MARSPTVDHLPMAGPRSVTASADTTHDATPTGVGDAFVRALLGSSPDLLIVVDEVGDFRFLSPAVERILGHRPHEWVGRSAFELIHPDDVGLAAESLVATTDTGTGVKAPLELRLLDAAGEWRTIEIVANNLLDDPAVAGVVISVRDLTERQRAESSSRADQRRFEQIFERAPIGVCVVDLNGRFLRVNAALSRLLGHAPTSLLTTTVDGITHPDHRAAVEPLTRHTVGHHDGRSTETRWLRADGSAVWVRVTVSVITDDDGEPLHTLAHVEDVEEQRRRADELHRAATHDALTGALNRAGLDQLLVEVFDEHAVASSTLLFLDLDRFKDVNDAYGHRTGDELLVAVTRRVAAALRGVDHVARIGGDEFVAVCPDLGDPAAVYEVAERVRHSLSRPFLLNAGDVSISVSIGAAVGAPGADPATVLELADDRAYRAKHAGRDRVHHA